MMNISFAMILAIAALLLGLLALLDIVSSETALSLGLICLALIHLIPAIQSQRGRIR